MLILYETPAGFALFKLKDEGKLKRATQLHTYFENIESAKKLISLSHFKKFTDTAEALASATAIIEGKMNKTLESFLKENIVDRAISEQLAVADKKLGQSIKDKFPNIECVSEPSVMELFRCIRFQLDELLAADGVSPADFASMNLGLAHSLGRYKLKFSPDKVDVMIVQAISLLDDLDKEINTYSMRVKEWYGWHFPELTRILADVQNPNIVYARVVKLLGLRSNIDNVDLTEVLEENLAEQVKETTKISMGTDISEEDITHIQDLCTQVLDIAEYREELYEYIKNRMQAIAPNLTVLVGELVGARLIAHAGSLLNLAKHPASTVQILGAEKALFRALKTKRATPKYGLIYHASLVGQTSAKNRGKISRILANKATLSIRVDALGDEDTKPIGVDNLEKVTHRLQELDGRRPTIPKPAVQLGKYHKSPGKAEYDTGEDIQLKPLKRKRDDEAQEKTPKKFKK